MPVIRGSPTTGAVTPRRRKELLDQLTRELAGDSSDSGPVIFEIPLEQSDKFDIMVVWDAWDSLRSEDRTSIIVAAYQGQEETIAQALGVTRQEAIEQKLLPYKVVPMSLGIVVRGDELTRAIHAEGGLAFKGKRLELRLPTMGLAVAARGRLSKQFAKRLSWHIDQDAGSVL